MSNARVNIQSELEALSEAVESSGVGTGSGLASSSGVSVLRRGAAITGLIMLETFIRDRTEEILKDLEKWPANYEDFPKRFRSRATIEALPHIEKYARMLQRQNEDFETIIFEQIGKMASMSPPAFAFTKFVAGDYTGNVSESTVEDLMKVFQIKNCWGSLHTLSSDIGFGVPSVKETLKALVRSRHRSAHSAGFNPNASDIVELPQNIRLVAICIDTALSASLAVAVTDWRAWVGDHFDWRAGLEIFFAAPSGNAHQLKRKDAKKAIRVVNDVLEARSLLPNKKDGSTQLLVEKGKDGRPRKWFLR